MPNGRVVGRKGPVYEVERLDDGAVIPCIAKGRGKHAVVGDQIRFEPGADTHLADALITGLAERKSALSRAHVLGKREQVVAANIDHIFIVVSVEPPLRAGLIDRYLVAASAQNIEASIIFNKLDLIDDDPGWTEEVDEVLAPYPGLGYRVHRVCAHDGRGLDTLLEALEGRCSIFVGHSGVGKTSLLNTLQPGLGERVNALSDSSGRGQHTTSTSALFKLGAGAEVIDSPGIRSFGLWGLGADDVAQHFVEFAERAEQCRFNNCRHLAEPSCAIKNAVDDESISPERYDSYLRIRESLEDDFVGSAQDYFSW